MCRIRDVKRGYNVRTINEEGVVALMVMGRGGGGVEVVVGQQGGAATRIAPLLPGLTSQGG
jgi:hypothetical protein